LKRRTGKIVGVVAEDVPEIVIDEGHEYSRRLVTNARQGAENLSFHLTTYTAGYQCEVAGDGIHEVVMFCVSGGTTVVVDDGHVIEVGPGMALYLPKEFGYSHTVGPEGMVMAVAATPFKE
jgi:uncharacterized RmlC-like cupin family protein